MDKDIYKRNYSMQSIQRAVKILRAFSIDNPRLTLTELNKITGIGKSSLQRILTTLTMEGLLQKDEQDKRYQLSLDFIFFAELVEKNSSLITIAKPIMEEINQQTTESVSLSVIDNNMRKCVYNIESMHELTTLTYAGQTSPLYAGASAKVLLAYYPKEKLENYLQSITLEKITETTIVDKDKLLQELQNIREKGYAFSNGERVKGAVSVSAPIFDPFSRIFASLTIIIPSARKDENDLDNVIRYIVSGAAQITEKLKI